MKLFGGAIAWRANKQDMVTMSSTEAELLAVLQTAREAIYLFCLIKALILVLPKALMIKCDNWQTIWLLVNKIMKLQTKLRHINIHLHWLRQEIQQKSIDIFWVSTKDMKADSLTKALLTVKHDTFVEMTSLEDQKVYLDFVRQEDEKKKSL